MFNAGNEIVQEPRRWSANELIPFGKYLLLDRITIGATAAVYRGIAYGEAGFERLAAIKRILPHMAGDHEFISTFIQEAKTAARLSHTNICPIFELGKVGESMYMAMECVIGKDLGKINQTLFKKGMYMPPEVAAWIASKMCEALDYAHNLKNLQGEHIGFIHRDLSPANILVSYEGDVKLIDFGVAKAVGQAQQTNVDALKKKLSYMSPEMVKGKRLDSRSDIFGVGVCLYEMVTSKQLFAGKNDVAVLKMVSQASVPPPSALLEDPPEELEMILMRALEREPDDRWQSADEMNTALQSYLSAEHSGFGVRPLSKWMDEMFEAEKEAEQARLNDLLEASRNPNVIAERRRFFSSPMGAAAVARDEVIKRMRAVSQASVVRGSSEAPTIPPPPKVPSLAKPTSDLKELDEEIEELDDLNPLSDAEIAASTKANFSSQPTVVDKNGIIEGFLLDQVSSAPSFDYEAEFDEDATEIFFNKEEEIGLEELYREHDKAQGPAAVVIRPAAIQRAPGAEYQMLAPASGLQQPMRYMPAPNVPPHLRARFPTAQMVVGHTPWWRSGWALSLSVGLITIAVTMFIYTQLLRQPAIASIIIRTSPAVPAIVLLDGIERGRSPMRMDGVPVGKHTLKVRAEGYHSITRQVALTKDATAILEFSLESDQPKIPKSDAAEAANLAASQGRSSGKEPGGLSVNGDVGKLTIRSVPWARVFIDDKDTGRITPILGFPIQAGTYYVGLRTPDDKLHIEKITVTAGETVELDRDYTQ